MAIDMTGQQFGKLTVIKLDHREKSGHSFWECLCECGITKVVRRNSLISGRQISCGCHKNSFLTKHGKNGTPLHKRFCGMHSRCNNKLFPTYANIQVCNEWKDFEAFEQWALANGFEEHLEIDRIDGTKDYSPDNCRWVTKKVNARNKPKKSGTTSQYIGVSFRQNRKTKCWKAYLRVNGKTLTKSFENEIDAAKWRDKQCKLHNLEGAILNF